MQSGRICARLPGLRLRAATLALLVLVLGHVSAWAHDGAVRHVVCARHGELVDAPQLARAIATGSWLVAVDGSPSDDHCAIANGIRHDATSVRGPAVLATALPAIAVHRVAPASRHAAPIDFRIAPKTSPPDPQS